MQNTCLSFYLLVSAQSRSREPLPPQRGVTGTALCTHNLTITSNKNSAP